MLKYFLYLIAIVFALHYGYVYVTSDDFQNWADKSKAPWTCTANLYIGGFFEMMSDYPGAQKIYQRTVARCPETSMGEEALFRLAVCTESGNDQQTARTVYEQFVEKYPSSRHARVAQVAIDRIKFSR